MAIASTTDRPPTVARIGIQTNLRQLREVVYDCHRALLLNNNPPTLFARGGAPVYIMPDEDGRKVIAPVTPAYLTYLLTQAANFHQKTMEVNRAVHPPQKAVTTLLAMTINEWNLPNLVSLSETPILRPDGSIVDQPGYDPETRTVYSPCPGLEIPPIPDDPTWDDIAGAIEVIDDAIGEFPFVDAASTVNAYAMLLTPTVRPVIYGCVPLALVNAKNPGTGKSLLMEVASRIHTGSAAPMKAIPADGDEWRKSLSAAILAGNSLTMFDNLDAILKSGHLSQAITCERWTDRKLGITEEMNLPQRTTFIVSGNNIRLGGDLGCRCYWINLDRDVPQPWRGVTYKHPNLKLWVMENRGQLLCALLTLARAWFRAGKPKADCIVLGNFESWCETIGGILSYAGLDGFLANADEMYAQGDVQENQWKHFLAALTVVFGEGFTVNELVREAGLKRAALVDGVETTLAELMPDELDKSNTRSIGRVFLGKQGRYFGNCKLVQTGQTGGVAKWKVVMSKDWA